MVVEQIIQVLEKGSSNTFFNVGGIGILAVGVAN